jgi:hypothetical protein
MKKRASDTQEFKLEALRLMAEIERAASNKNGIKLNWLLKFG